MVGYHLPSLSWETIFFRRRRHPRALSILSMSRFDITKPVFDLYSLRQVRGDALNKYSSLDQVPPAST
jgi:hypothetical protein